VCKSRGLMSKHTCVLSLSTLNSIHLGAGDLLTYAYKYSVNR
jgi:hypothetical protein